MKNEEQIESMRENAEFIEAVQNFRVNSHLFFVFNLSGDGAASESSAEKVLVYEAYLAGTHTLFQLLQNGSLHLSCNYCEGIAVRRFNFHERTLKVTAVVSKLYLVSPKASEASYLYVSYFVLERQ